jgi:hypothetical protein
MCAVAGKLVEHPGDVATQALAGARAGQRIGEALDETFGLDDDR